MTDLEQIFHSSECIPEHVPHSLDVIFFSKWLRYLLQQKYTPQCTHCNSYTLWKCKIVWMLSLVYQAIEMSRKKCFLEIICIKIY